MRPADLVAGSVLPMMAVPAAAVIAPLLDVEAEPAIGETQQNRPSGRPSRDPHVPPSMSSEGYFNNGLDDYNRATNAGEPTASEVRWMHESGLTSGVLPSPLLKLVAASLTTPCTPSLLAPFS